MKDRSHTRPKLSDVARMARVGNATVSRVLNGGKNVSEEKAQRVAAVIRELDYKPNRAARSLKGASSGIIGMIVPSISDMFFSRCAEAVERVVREEGDMLIVTASHDRPNAVVESFQQLMLHHIDGLILVQSLLQEPALLEELQRTTIPVVGIDRPLLGTRFRSVLCENMEGARTATEHLLWHGYESVISVQVNARLYTMRERVRGYRAAMKAAGQTPIEESIHDSRSAVLALRRHLPARRPPLAIFAGNNLTARTLFEATRLLGLRMPDEIAMVSFDDFDLADALHPPMSVVQQPVDALGMEAARLLYRQMQRSEPAAGDDTPNPILLPTRLIVRGSCGCDPAAEQSSREATLAGEPARPQHANTAAAALG